jgi:hypothetical protein
MICLAEHLHAAYNQEQHNAQSTGTLAMQQHYHSLTQQKECTSTAANYLRYQISEIWRDTLLHV